MDQRWGWDITFTNVVRCKVININLRPNWNKFICKCLVNWKKYIFSAAAIERHRADLNTAQKDIIRLKDNLSSIVDECSVLRTQIESMGDNLCRSGLRKKLLDSSLLISS